jgi:Ribosomal protein L30/L7E
VLKVPKLLAIIRIKGTVKVPQEIAETLERLNLKKRNSMVIYYDDPSIIGMIKKAERYVAWGEVNDLEILVQTLKNVVELSETIRLLKRHYKNSE